MKKKFLDFLFSDETDEDLDIELNHDLFKRGAKGQNAVDNMLQEKDKDATAPGEGKKSKSRIIRVKGMSCQSCVDKIQQALKKLKGVRYVAVSLLDDAVYVKYSNNLNLDSVMARISELGYAVEGYKPDKERRKRGFMQGLAYGLVPHIGCIAFLIGSVFGVTLLMQFFRPLLMNRYFFHFLIALSLVFATISVVVYLHKNGLLSAEGARRQWKYISVMYGSTVFINLVLFMVIFPLLANVTVADGDGITGNVVAGSEGLNAADSSVLMAVDIPCPGHAPLISNELKTLNGIQSVKFSFPNKFDVKYDSSRITLDDMLALEVFTSYPAQVIDTGSKNGGLNEVAAKGQEGVESFAVAAAGAGSESCGISGGGCGCGG